MKHKVVRAILAGRSVRFLPPYPLEELKPYFQFQPKSYRFMPAYRMGYWDGFIKLLKQDKAPRGVFEAQCKQIEADLGITFQVQSKHISSPTNTFFKKGKLVSDRPYQNECVDAMQGAAANGGGLVLGATGSGKTFMAAMFFERLVGSACFIVDELHLLHQARKEIEKHLDEPVGFIGQGEFCPQRITVATVQTLFRHCQSTRYAVWVKKISVLIVDEVHTAMNKRNFSVVEAIKPAAVYGLTATLEMTQKPVRMRAWALAGPVIYEYPLERGQSEGFLAQGIVGSVRYPGIEEWPDQFDRYEMPYPEAYNSMVVHDVDRNVLIRDLVREARKRDKHIVVLVERLAHIRNLAKLLSGIPYRIMSGQKEVARRIADAKKFEKERVRVILANKVFKKGIDVKRIDVIIDAAAMKSRNDAVQKFGRGVRLHEEKKGLIYLDISDEGNRFEKAAKRRRRALKAKRLHIVKLETNDARKIFDVMEKKLARLVSKVAA